MIVSPRQKDLCPHISGMLRDYIKGVFDGETNSFVVYVLGASTANRELLDEYAIKLTQRFIVCMNGLHEVRVTFHPKNLKYERIPFMEITLTSEDQDGREFKMNPSFTIKDDIRSQHLEYVYRYIKTFGHARKSVTISDRLVKDIKEMTTSDMEDMRDMISL